MHCFLENDEDDEIDDEETEEVGEEQVAGGLDVEARGRLVADERALVHLIHLYHDRNSFAQF